MATRAWEAAGITGRRVTAVSRFTGGDTRTAFEMAGVATMSRDLLGERALDDLPEAANVLYLAGMKFGSTEDEPTTWAMNTFLPGLVARRFPHARIVALSTANVYPFTNPARGGARESAAPSPIGDYAQSCLGRERILAYHSAANGTPMAMIRLAYANALRYGVLLDIAQAVAAGAPIDVSMGFANVIWQGDANAAILASFGLCASPPAILNLSGPETISVRRAAHRLEEALAAPAPTFTGSEAETALLIDSTRAHTLFGYPRVPLGQLVEWTAAWLKGGGRLLNKPTHFQARDGRF
jgi:nucleoside-diphosphate-sugar epimerase